MLEQDKIKNVNFRNYIVYIALIVIFLVFSVALFNKGFITQNNIMNIFRQTAMISVMSVGMTIVLCAGEIDLSIGSIVALSAVLTAYALRYFNIWIAILTGLLTGIIIGFINGLLVSKIRIPSFLVTLGMMSILSGVARWATNLVAIPVTNRVYNFIFGSGNIRTISVLFIWTIIFVAIGQILLKKTSYGRYILATGGNEVAAKFSGINTKNIKMSVLIISGITAAFAGMLYAGRLHGARYDLGEADLLTVIAAVIIGGTSLSGGKGTVIGALAGSLIMGMVNNGLILMGLDNAQQMIFRGIIIIGAVSFGIEREKY